jgi:RNA polymerase sigma factor (sigma-70 family)
MPRAIVLFGDVVRSRRDATGSTAWLRALVSELHDAYDASERLAPFDFTQGDELQALIAPSADPFTAVLHAALRPDTRRMRWVAVIGEVDPGRGRTTQRSGPAFIRARERLDEAAARRDDLLVETGHPPSDRQLDRLAPLLADLLEELTPSQRRLTRLMLIEGLRQSEAAERLGISRATVSVAAERARVRRLAPLVDALRELVRTGVEAGAVTGIEAGA